MMIFISCHKLLCSLFVCSRIVADNNHTITERSFRSYSLPTGTESLPNSLYYASTGFVRGKSLHNATSSVVCDGNF